LTVERWTELVKWSRESIEWLNQHEKCFDSWMFVAYAASACALIQYHTWVRRRDPDAMETLRLLKDCVQRWESCLQPGHMSARRKTAEIIILLYEATQLPPALLNMPGDPQRLNPTVGVSDRPPGTENFRILKFRKDPSRPGGGVFIADEKSVIEAVNEVPLGTIVFVRGEDKDGNPTSGGNGAVKSESDVAGNVPNEVASLLVNIAPLQQAGSHGGNPTAGLGALGGLGRLALAGAHMFGNPAAGFAAMGVPPDPSPGVASGPNAMPDFGTVVDPLNMGMQPPKPTRPTSTPGVPNVNPTMNLNYAPAVSDAVNGWTQQLAGGGVHVLNLLDQPLDGNLGAYQLLQGLPVDPSSAGWEEYFARMQYLSNAGSAESNGPRNAGTSVGDAAASGGGPNGGGRVRSEMAAQLAMRFFSSSSSTTPTTPAPSAPSKPTNPPAPPALSTAPRPPAAAAVPPKSPTSSTAHSRPRPPLAKARPPPGRSPLATSSTTRLSDPEPAKSGPSRVSEVLPGVICKLCGTSVPLELLGEHDCEAKPPPKPPAATSQIPNGSGSTSSPAQSGPGPVPRPSDPPTTIGRTPSPKPPVPTSPPPPPTPSTTPAKPSGSPPRDRLLKPSTTMENGTGAAGLPRRPSFENNRPDPGPSLATGRHPESSGNGAARQPSPPDVPRQQPQHPHGPVQAQAEKSPPPGELNANPAGKSRVQQPPTISSSLPPNAGPPPNRRPSPAPGARQERPNGPPVPHPHHAASHPPPHVPPPERITSPGFDRPSKRSNSETPYYIDKGQSNPDVAGGPPGPTLLADPGRDAAGVLSTFGVSIPDTKVGGEAGMAGVGRRGFAAVAQAAMFVGHAPMTPFGPNRTPSPGFFMPPRGGSPGMMGPYGPGGPPPSA
ncbi:hypothetical protein FRB99_001877, partial [Tulasnella sp. 403]